MSLRKLRFGSFLPLAGLFLPAISTAQSTWVGTLNSNWADVGNWVPGLPGEGGDVFIADTTASNNTLILAAPRTMGALSFGSSGTRTTTFTINTEAANQLTIQGGLNASGALTGSNLNLRGHYIVEGDQTWTINGDTSLNDQGVFLRAVVDQGSTTPSGSVLLEGDLTKSGDGQLHIGGTAISGEGDLIVESGALKINAGFSQPVVLAGSGSLVLNGSSVLGIFRNSGSMDITRPIVLNGTASIVTRNGSLNIVDLDSPVTVNGGHVLEVGTAATGITNINGAWSGSGSLERTGAGTLNLNGDFSAYTGDLSLEAGTTHLNATIGGDVVAEIGGILAGEGTISGNLEMIDSRLQVDPVSAGTLSVEGDLALTGLSEILLTGAPASSAPFTVLGYEGTLSGDEENLTLPGGSFQYRNPTFDTSTQGQITLSVGRETRTWAGGAEWDVNFSENWQEGDQLFYQFDDVVFGETGAGTVNLYEVLMPGSITIEGAADYTFTSTGGGHIAGTTGLVKNGTGTTTLAGLNTFTGGIEVNTGTLRGSGTSQVFGANGQEITVASGATLDFGGAMTANRDLQGTISGTGVTGDGAVVNTGAGQQSGFRTLTLAADASIGGTARWDVRPIVAGTAILDLAGFTLTKTGTNKIAFVDGVVDADGDIEIDAGTLAFTRSAVSGAGSVTVRSGATLQLENYTSGTFTKTIAIDGGRLQNNGANFLLGSDVSLSGAASVDVGDGNTLTVAQPVTGSGSLGKVGPGTLALAAAATYTGTTTISTGALRLDTGGDLASPTVDLASTSAALIFNGTEDLTFSNVITGSGITGNNTTPSAVTKNNTNTVTLTGDNSYTGTTRLAAGTLAIGSGGAVFGTGLVDLRAGSIRSSDATPRVIANEISMSDDFTFGSAGTGNLLFTGPVAGGSFNKEFAVENALTEFSGSISGTGNGTTFTKAGPGTLIFSGDNTYTQTTTIASGVLQVGHGGTTGTLGTSAVFNNASLVIHRDNPEGTSEFVISNTISGTGSLTHSGPAYTILSAENSYAGDTIVTAGTLSPSWPVLSDAAPVRISGSGTLDLFHAQTDVVHSLFLDGVPQQPGLWGRVGSVAALGADFETPFITGDGLLSVTVLGETGSPYDSWASDRGLAPGNDGPGDNPDGDRWNNLGEFAFDGDPFSGADAGKVVVQVAEVAGAPTLTLTLPVRAGVGPFTGETSLSATGEGVTYHIEGSTELGDWSLDIEEVTGADATAIQAGLPALSDGGWTYRTFRTPGPVDAVPSEFIRARVE